MSFPDLALHTVTTKPWNVYQCIEHYARRGIGGVSIWRDVLEGEDLKKVSKAIRDAGLSPISLVRGGFFTGLTEADREMGLQDTRNGMRQAAELGLGSIVLVTGATVGQGPRENYQQTRDAIGELARDAKELGVDLLIEPLHPVYAGDRSSVPSLAVANQLCAEIAHEKVGIAFDVYHCWWELDLKEQLARAGKEGWLRSYHICDFKPDQEDLLLDRGVMGEGCVRLAEIDTWVKEAGFQGKREVEIFSKKWWQRDQGLFLDYIIGAAQEIYS